MAYTYQSGQKIECEHCNHISDEPVEHHALYSAGDKAFEKCENCGIPFSITNNDDECKEYTVDFHDPDTDEHFSESDFYFDSDFD